MTGIYAVIGAIIETALNTGVVSPHGYQVSTDNYDMQSKVTTHDIKVEFVNDEHDVFDGEFADVTVGHTVFGIAANGNSITIHISDDRRLKTTATIVGTNIGEIELKLRIVLEALI